MFFQPDIIQVLLVDDNPVVRMSVSLFLETYDDIAVVAEADSGQQAVSLVDELHPDVALVDLVLPGMDGVATTRALHQHNPSLVIFLLTSSLDYDRIDAALQAGAVGYLPKSSGNDIVDAIYTTLSDN